MQVDEQELALTQRPHRGLLPAALLPLRVQVAVLAGKAAGKSRGGGGGLQVPVVGDGPRSACGGASSQ